MTRLTEKTAIVTGGGKGIGQAIARRFGQEGARVAIWEQDEEAGKATADQIAQNGGSAIQVACDVTNPDSIAKALRQTTEELSAPSILVNNAGIAGPTSNLEDLSPDDWRRCIDQFIEINY